MKDIMVRKPVHPSVKTYSMCETSETVIGWIILILLQNSVIISTHI